jgi:hypothetical protein
MCRSRIARGGALFPRESGPLDSAMDFLPSPYRDPEFLGMTHLCCNIVRDAISLQDELPRSRQLYLESAVFPNRHVFFFVRLTLTLMMDAVWLASFSISLDRGYWFIYLTHWTLTLEAVYLNLMTYATYVNAKEHMQLVGAQLSQPMNLITSSNSVGMAQKSLYYIGVLHSIALPATFTVMVLFWSLVFPVDTESAQRPLTYMVHLLNFVVMFINFMISRHPFHFKNGIFVAIYLLTYVLFTIVYWAAGESTSLSKVPRNDQRSLHCS